MVKLATRVVYEFGEIKTTVETIPIAAIDLLSVPVPKRPASWNRFASLSSLPPAIHNRYDLDDWHSLPSALEARTGQIFQGGRMIISSPFKKLLGVTCVCWCLSTGISVNGQETSSTTQTTDETKEVREPVFRISKLVANEKLADSAPAEPLAGNRVASALADPKLPMTPTLATPVAPSATAHPLDTAIDMAHTGLDGIQAKINDYTATMVKRERVNDKLGDHEFVQVKIRNERTIDSKTVPFSIYMKFLKPKSVAGREVIWVEGQNDNKIIAHETGLIGFKTFHLDPTGWLAMQNNRHPIYEAGLENLVKKLIEKAERDRAAGECQVEYRKGAKINGRVCTLISVTHAEQKAPYEFHNAQVFIDDEMQIPIRYAAYDWPRVEGEKPQVLEEYTYIDVTINVGLTDSDFDPKNKAYNYPR